MSELNTLSSAYFPTLLNPSQIRIPDLNLLISEVRGYKDNETLFEDSFYFDLREDFPFSVFQERIFNALKAGDIYKLQFVCYDASDNRVYIGCDPAFIID